jgi:hypothetical protein
MMNKRFIIIIIIIYKMKRLIKIMRDEVIMFPGDQYNGNLLSQEGYPVFMIT